VQLILSIARASNFHLTAVKFSFADNAKALVFGRSPGSKSIFGAQDREAIVEFEMCDHNVKSSLLVASKRTIGPLEDSLDDWVVR